MKYSEYEISREKLTGSTMPGVSISKRMRMMTVTGTGSTIRRSALVMIMTILLLNIMQALLSRRAVSRLKMNGGE